MAEIKWETASFRALERRKAGQFFLWAGDTGRWEVSAFGELLERDDAADMSAAKLCAETALRKLLTEALGELGAAS